MHPDLVRRFVALSLLPARHDAQGGMWFVPEQAAVVARIQRLRAGLPLNYAAIAVVLGLLERIDQLEAAARSSAPVP
jgi:chaperone modulatory protein CbpM